MPYSIKFYKHRIYTIVDGNKPDNMTESHIQMMQKTINDAIRGNVLGVSKMSVTTNFMVALMEIYPTQNVYDYFRARATARQEAKYNVPERALNYLNNFGVK